MINVKELTPHFLQTKYWAQVRSQMGWEAEWIDDALLLTRKLPLDMRFGYMPQVDLTTLNWEKLQQYAKQHHLTHIQLDPDNLARDYVLPVDTAERYGLQKTAPLYLRHTVVLDITKSDVELQSAMKEKTRYNLRLALKKGVQITITDNDKDFEIFLKLFFETVARQRYFGREPGYYKTIWQTLKPQGKAKIAIATYDGVPVTAWMLFLSDNVIYYPYGGSSDQHRNVMATYALVWGIMNWGRERGFKFLDLWGTLGPNAKESDKDFGFHRFKTGWGGEEIEYVNAYDMVIDKTWYNLFRFGNSLRWLLLHVKKVFSH